MRHFAFFTLVLASIAGFLAWEMLDLQLHTYNADQRTMLQFAFNGLAGIALFGPILAALAIREEFLRTRRQRKFDRYYRSERRLHRSPR